MKTTHTPGPWNLDRTSENGWSIYPAAPKIRAGYSAKGKPLFNDVCGFNWRGTEHDANASLIAAAPELLEALEDILPLAETALNYIKADNADLDFESALESIKKVIAKARGES